MGTFCCAQTKESMRSEEFSMAKKRKNERLEKLERLDERPQEIIVNDEDSCAQENHLENSEEIIAKV